MKIFPIIPIWIMLIICAVLTYMQIADKKNRTRRIAIIWLLFVINVRIMIKTNDLENYGSNLNILFVIDNTISMAAEDYDKELTRLEATKKDVSYIIDKFGEAKFSIITFSNSAQVLVPFTKDISMVKHAVNIMQVTDKLFAEGTSLDTPLEEMIEILKGRNENKTRKSIIFFISDGEATKDGKIKSFSEVSKYVETGAVLGYGTQERWLYENTKSI